MMRIRLLLMTAASAVVAAAVIVATEREDTGVLPRHDRAVDGMPVQASVCRHGVDGGDGAAVAQVLARGKHVPRLAFKHHL